MDPTPMTFRPLGDIADFFQIVEADGTYQVLEDGRVLRVFDHLPSAQECRSAFWDVLGHSGIDGFRRLPVHRRRSRRAGDKPVDAAWPSPECAPEPVPG